MKPGDTRYYLGVAVKVVAPCDDGWVWGEWPDGRHFKFWADQLEATPWGRGIRVHKQPGYGLTTTGGEI